jgi:hypothetical protein
MNNTIIHRLIDSLDGNKNNVPVFIDIIKNSGDDLVKHRAIIITKIAYNGSIIDPEKEFNAYKQLLKAAQIIDYGTRAYDDAFNIPLKETGTYLQKKFFSINSTTQNDINNLDRLEDELLLIKKEDSMAESEEKKALAKYLYNVSQDKNFLALDELTGMVYERKYLQQEMINNAKLADWYIINTFRRNEFPLGQTELFVREYFKGVSFVPMNN